MYSNASGHRCVEKECHWRDIKVSHGISTLEHIIRVYSISRARTSLTLSALEQPEVVIWHICRERKGRSEKERKREKDGLSISLTSSFGTRAYLFRLCERKYYNWSWIECSRAPPIKMMMMTMSHIGPSTTARVIERKTVCSRVRAMLWRRKTRNRDGNAKHARNDYICLASVRIMGKRTKFLEWTRT